MNLKKSAAYLLSAVMAVSSFGTAAVKAEEEGSGIDSAASIMHIETLGRGLAAMKTSGGIYLTWRLQADEDNVFGTSAENVSFNIYRDGELIGNESKTTNFTDKDGKITSKYSVAPVRNNEEGNRSEEITVFESGSNYFDIPLVKPDDETITADTETNTYSFFPTDCSCGDLDGDGKYEIVVKWVSNELDVGKGGYSGTTRLAAYKLDGTKMWENDINFGTNVYSSAHTIQFLVYDFDGDGRAEITAQTAPGSKDAKGKYVSLVSHDTAIKSYSILSVDGNKIKINMADNKPVIYAAGYDDNGALEHIQLFRDYKSGESELTADFEIDRAFVWTDLKPADGADETKESVDLRSANDGRISSGAEYLTVFDGETGAAVDTINYPTARYNVSCWGKSDGGNRSLRFLADVAYLDGEKPYAVYWRGYYNHDNGRTGIAGVSFDGERLSVDYQFDTRKGQPGYTSGNEIYAGEGNHNITVADVDNDGKDEFISGALCMEVDKDNKLNPKWCSFREHGDALHIGDYDPTNDGLEYFSVHEGGGYDVTTDTGEVKTLDYGMTVYNAEDGTELFHQPHSKDTGRGMMANVGAGGYYQINGTGNYISNGGSDFEAANIGLGNNFRIFWDGDLYDELLNGTEITSWNGSKMAAIFNASGCTQINGTKANPSLQADLFGDWREEVIYPTTDGNALRVYTTNIKTDYKMKSLMYDGVYRSGVAAEQTAYNQPPHIGYYLADEVFFGTLTGIDVDMTNTKSKYYVGEEFDKTGIKVTAHYSESDDREVVNYSISGYDPLKTGEQELTLKYLGVEKSVKVNVVGEKDIETSLAKSEYNVGEEFDKSQLKVQLVYEDDTAAAVENYKISGYDSLKAGEQELTVTYKGVQNTYTKKINVTVKTGVTVDENGTVIGYTGDESEIIVPVSFGGTEIKKIASGTFASSNAEKIYIYSKTVEPEGDSVFPEGVIIVCYENSAVKLYADNAGIDTELIPEGDEVTFEGDFYSEYSNKNMLMQSDADKTLKDEFITYNTKGAATFAPWYKADFYGFAVKTEQDNNYLSVNAGIYDDWNKFNQVYITLNEPRSAEENYMLAFDIMFPSNSGTPYVELQDADGNIIDTLSTADKGFSNGVWYHYALVCEGGSYSCTVYSQSGDAVVVDQISLGEAKSALSAIAFKQGFGSGATNGIVYIDNIIIK